MASINGFTDVFPGTTVDNTKWSTYGTTTVASNVLTVAGNSGLDSIATWDLTSSSITVKVNRVATGAAHPLTNLVISNPALDGTNLRWSYDNNTGLLSAQLQSGFADGSPVTVTYSATTHLYWRISEAGGNITFSTSADGLSWSTPLRTIATSLAPWITAGGYHLSVDNAAATLTGQFSNVNILPGGNSKLITLQDTFDATLDTTNIWTTSGTPTPSIGSGLLTIANTSTFGDIHTKSRYDATGSEISVNVTRVATNSAVTAVTNLVLNSLEANTDARIQYKQSDLKIHFRHQKSGSDPAEVSITYNATDHAWWRIRETAGTLFFETSPTGQAGSWVIQRQDATSTITTSAGSLYLNSVICTLAVDNGMAAISGAQFDSLNNLPAASANPKIGTLQDNFNSGLNSVLWGTNGTTTVAGGTVSIPSSSDLHTNTTYDLIGSLAIVEVPQVAVGTGIQTNFVIDNPLVGGTTLRIYRDTTGSVLSFGRFTGYGDDGTGAAFNVTYDATSMRWWKIEEISGTINFATSPDTNTWTIRRSIPTSTAAWVNNINIYLSVDGTVTTPASMDNFNQPVAITPGLTNPKAATLADDFTGTVVDTTSKWVVLGTGGVTESNQLQITATNTENRGVESKSAYDLQESNFVVQITNSTTTGDEAIMRVYDVGGSGGSARITLSGTTLIAGLYSGAVATDVTSVTISPITYWVRIRDAAGITFFEYSVDGSFVDLPVIHTITTPTWINNVKLQLYSDNTIANPTPTPTQNFTPNTASIPGGTSTTVDFRTANRLFLVDKWSIGSCVGGTSDLFGSPSNAAVDAKLDALGPITWRVATTEWHAVGSETGPWLRRSSNIRPATVGAWVQARKGTLYPLLLWGSPGAPANGLSDNDNGFTAADATALIKYFNDNGGQNGGPVERVGIGNEPTCGNAAWGLSASAYATLFEACYQNIHALYPSVTLHGPSIGCVNPADGTSVDPYITAFMSAMGGNVSHVGGLTWHAYDGATTISGITQLSAAEYYNENHAIHVAYPSLSVWGCEEFNWSSGSGNSNWQNFVFQTNIYGSCLKAGAHAYQFLFAGGMGMFSKGQASISDGTPLPSFWAMATHTGYTGTATKIRDVRQSYAMPATSSISTISVYGYDCGKIIAVNTSGNTDQAITIGMGGTSSGKYDVWTAGQGVPQTTGFTRTATQASYSAGTLSLTIPWGSVSIIELFA